MSFPLLATKFNIPPDNLNLIRRERLTNLINEGLQRSHILTLICAPTGYGKTTLVSQWIHQQVEEQFQQGETPRQFIWLTLDQMDNDLARFIPYLVASFQQIQAGLGQDILAMLQNPRAAAPQLLATFLINDLSSMGGHYLLVLDDYHTITAQPIHEFISYLVDHLPQQMHLIIISRSDPAIPLALLRARGQLTELRQQDLAMTSPEISQFFRQLVELDISPEYLQMLVTRTEGWAAGLQLAALSMRHIEDIPAFIRAFSGGHDFIADYLTGEVLDQLDEGTKNFLLQTSIVEQFSASLCQAITGQGQSAQILEKLIEANLFIIPLDYHGEWYRYHALFADLLRKRLQQSSKGFIADLHIKAGRWYAQNKMMNQAVEHFLAGLDYAGAAGLIEENAEQILMQGQTVTFLRWMELFPLEQLYIHPVLVVYQGMAAILLGKIPDVALSLIQEIAASSARFQGEANTLQALYAVMTGKALDAICYSEKALVQLNTEQTFLRILAADSLAMAHALRGDSSSAIRAFEQVVENARQADNVIMTLMGLSNLAGLRYQLGQLHQAYDAYQQVLEISEERLGSRSHAVGKVYLGLGELAREWNDLDSAYSYLSTSVEIFKQFVDIGTTMAYLSIVRIHIAQDEWRKAQSILDEARLHAKASKNTLHDDNLTELMQARLWIALGELQRVELWARGRGLWDKPIDDLVAMADQNATAFDVLQGEYLTLVRLFIAQGKPSKALDILAVLHSHNEKRGQIRRVIEALVLQAVAFHLLGEKKAALQTFLEALELAEPQGYIRTFLDEGQPVAQLLYQVIAADKSFQYANNLLAEFKTQDVSPVGSKKPGSEKNLLEPLSERELEVLGLIAEGLTNQEIGRRLHISLSTVKGHTTHIYGKLGVKNRANAIALAHNLGLLL